MDIALFFGTLAAQFALYAAVTGTLASWRRVNGVKITRDRSLRNMRCIIDRLGER